MAEPEDVWEAIDYCYEQGWAADGLPVVPPTEERVREFLECASREAKEVVATMQVVCRTCTVEKAAVNAVMAGCLPGYFPVVLAALEALSDDRYHLHGSSASPAGCGPLLVINGPIRKRLKINSTLNVLGPGCRANATIGRSISLILMNVFGMHPEVFGQSTQGFPGKYTLCIAENEEESPWEPLHVEKGCSPESSTVTVYGALGTTHVGQRQTNRPEDILLTIADTMSHLGSINSHAQTAVIMGPEHAHLLARQGWSKAEVKSFLHQHARRSLPDLQKVSKAYRGVGGAGVAGRDGYVHQGQAPEDILLVVAGANNAGISTVLHPWGRRLSPVVGGSPPQELPSMDHVTREIREVS